MQKLVAIAFAVVASTASFLYFRGSSRETASSAIVARESQQTKAAQGAITAELIDTFAQPPNPGQPTAPLTPEQQDQAACSAVWERRQAREKAALEAEPKDPAWAYPMEQKLREYLTQALQSGQMEVTSIDCRTTFCQIKALVHDLAGSTEFNQAISAVSGKPWNDFSGMGTSISEESDKTFYIGQLNRPQFKERRPSTQDEQAAAACTAREMAKQDRERAIRDAQPKDPIWAEPMEQMIRQYLTKHVGKQRVEHIEVDCRTTFCRIEAKGQTIDAALAMQKAAQAVADEPWAELRSGEGSSSGYGDSWEQQYFLYKR